MCRLKSKLVFGFCGLFVMCGQSFLCSDCGDEYSQRLAVQDELDTLIDIIYEIHRGDTTQEEGLGRLEAHITMMRFHLWFWIDD